MRRRFGIKKKRTPPPVKNILMVTLILFILLLFGSMHIINNGIKPTLMEVAEVKTTEFATRGINSAVKFAEEYTFEDLTETTTDNEGNVSFIGWDSSVVNKINRAATDRVEEFFHSMNRGEPPDYEDPLDEPEMYGDTVDELVERDPTVVEIPIGQATGNTILANLGPKIPVNLELVGNVQTDIVEQREEFGINNVLVTLYVIVEAEVQIVIPFTTEVTSIDTKILIDKHLVMGDVPEFYGGDGKDPSISVPKKDLQDN
ncbi:sporulation protein YunB [Virgibacillus alimentarius]|uniref:Sporulation protein YunB n=1 Tax=Virgibacillus alimentarius TaxID=698769 RepID=A0ABS4S767_9BACI|nr:MULTISPECIES: sporulation protein YunB [Virgibacillus]MBP2257327.1 sporulation protein YunB [Virgibacillus alimentarius]HLR67889.1 sporulation protein YunB [Virgibacillus sp.]